MATLEFLRDCKQQRFVYLDFANDRSGSAAAEPAAARALLRFPTSPAAASILRSVGVEPFVE